MMSKVIVIGGGPAGMMAAFAAAENGHRVLLLEKNEKLGKKLYITGKGRCNVTNACERDKFFENIVSNPKFLYSAYHACDNRKLMEVIKNAGCPLKVERGERVFPVSDHASEITAAFQRLLKEKGVQIRLHTTVLDVAVKDGQVSGVRLADGSMLTADAVVAATGGLSYQTTGSTGDGYGMAQTYGHTVKECAPALVPMETAEDWCRSLQGLSLKNVTLTMTCKKKQIYQGFGEMLFTHFGVSGPLVLSASSYYNRCKEKDSIWLAIDLKPALSVEQLDKRFLREFEENHNRQIKNVLGNIYPAKLVPVMLLVCDIGGEQRVGEVTRRQRQRLVEVTKNLSMQVKRLRGFDEAIITQGGVAVKEINPSTMESKLVQGLYFAGEVLDVDALTGGFNLQIAWSTGYLAGASIS